MKVKPFFIYLFFFFPIFPLVSQTKADSVSVFDEILFEDVLYKTTRAGDSLFLDIFLPRLEDPGQRFPVLIYIHGGSWMRGDKTMEEPYFRNNLKETSLASGFAVVSIGYRLLNDPELHFPAPVRDAKDAVRWIHAFGSQYNLDSDNIGITGESSGAHLALLAAYSSDSMWQGSEELKNYSSKVNYVINNCGPVDINKLLHTNLGRVELFLAKIFVPKKVMKLREELILNMTSLEINDNKEEVIERLKKHSPAAYVAEFSVPTLSFHAARDRVVPGSQARLLHRLLKKTDTEHELVTVKRAAHVYHNLSDEEIDPLVEKTIEFMTSHLK